MLTRVGVDVREGKELAEFCGGMWVWAVVGGMRVGEAQGEPEAYIYTIAQSLLNVNSTEL
jgi:hypothetical protein